MWTSGAELSCSGGGSSFTGEVVLSGAGEDASTGEVVWLAEGTSGVAVAAGLSMLGLALELEACSGASGALKERKHQVSNQREKYVGNDAKERNLPRGDGSLPFGQGHANLLSFRWLGCVGLWLHASLPVGTSAGGRRSLVQRGGVDNHVVRDS
jgi:hypothetical protein